jgi:hypothetical protein
VLYLSRSSLQQWKQGVQAQLANLQRQLPYLANDPNRAAWAQQQLQALQQRAAVAYTVDQSYSVAILEAVFLPWSGSSSGTTTGPSGVMPYCPPRDLRATLALLGSPTILLSDPLTRTATSLGLALWLCTLMPVSFLLLPVSRRHARVRREHLVRVAVYGLFAPAAAMLAAFVLVGLGAVDLAHRLLRYGVVPMLVVWWTAAIHRYLRMPHSAGVALLLSVLVGLLFVVTLWLVAREFLVWWITPGL